MSNSVYDIITEIYQEHPTMLREDITTIIEAFLLKLPQPAAPYEQAFIYRKLLGIK